MRRRIVGGLLAILIFAVIAGSYTYWHWLNSPRYALQQMVIALKNRDVDLLFKHIDLAAIIDNFGQEAREDLGQLIPGKPKEDELDRLGRRLLEKLVRNIPPKVVEALKPQIMAGVETFLKNLSTTQILGLAAAVTTARIDTRGEMATVTLEDPKTREKFRFAMSRDPQDGRWKITAITYQDFKKFLKQEFQ